MEEVQPVMFRKISGRFLIPPLDGLDDGFMVLDRGGFINAGFEIIVFISSGINHHLLGIAAQILVAGDFEDIFMKISVALKGGPVICSGYRLGKSSV